MGIFFPSELVDAFLEQILPNSNDSEVNGLTFTTLLACTLTSRSFAAAARRRLFSNIVIGQNQNMTRTAEEMGRRVNTLIGLLRDEQSDMAQLVRRIEIRVDDEEETILEESSNLNGLLSILCARASNLSCIELSTQIPPSTCTEIPSTSWTELPSQTRGLLLDLFRLCPISRLQFGFLCDIPSDIATIHQCPLLQHIELDYANFIVIEDRLEVLASLPGYGRYRLRRLGSGELYVAEVDVHIFSALDQDVLPLYKLLSHERVMMSIETCFIHVIQGEFDPPLSSFDLGGMPNLRRLVIGQSGGNISRVVHKLVSILHHGQRPSKLEKIEFVIGVSFEYEDPYTTASDIDYGLFEGLRPSSFLEKHPLVQTFIVRLCIDLWSQEGYEEWMNAGHHIAFEPESVKTIKERVQENLEKVFIDDGIPRIAPLGDVSLWCDVQVFVEVDG